MNKDDWEDALGFVLFLSVVMLYLVIAAIEMKG